jgi:hypothetical protein
MFQTKVIEKIKTHILCSITFSANRAVCEIMWKSMVEPDRPQMTIYTAHALCMLDNWGYRHTLRICDIYCLCTSTLLPCTHIASRVILMSLPCVFNRSLIHSWISYALIRGLSFSKVHMIVFLRLYTVISLLSARSVAYYINLLKPSGNFTYHQV